MPGLAANELLRRIDRRLQRVGGPHEQIRVVLREACQMTQSPAGEFYCADAGVGRMVALTGWGVDAPARRFLRQSSAYAFAPDVGAIGKAWTAPGVVSIERLDEDPDYLRAREAFGAGLQSLVVVAVPGGPAGARGVLGLYGRPFRTPESQRAEVALIRERIALLPIVAALTCGLLTNVRVTGPNPDVLSATA